MLTRRTLIRLASFSIAAIAALGARVCSLSRDASALRLRQLSGYSAALEELAFSCDSLSGLLEKELYTSSPELRQELAAELYSQSVSAKGALARLPVTELRLENTNKFLSQVGSYSLALCGQELRGQELTEEDYEALEALYEFSQELTGELWALEGAAMSGEISLEELSADTGEPPAVTEGIMDFEGSFDNYPKLIYDGPFSDNLLEKVPELTQGQGECPADRALLRAAEAMEVQLGQVEQLDSTGGRLPCYRFSAGGASCEITCAGGFLADMLKMREVTDQGISQEAAVQKALDYLEGLGILSMEATYHQIQDNVMTVNLCYSDNGVRVYGDLVKVLVAMDNGEILGCDCKGFIVNHRDREYPENTVSLSRAQQEVSPRLMLTGHRLALIPRDNGEERYCYEFTCRSKNGRNVLVYIDAQTAKEEQILMLIENESGTLTL